MKNEYHYTISRTDRIYLVTFCMALLCWELVKKVIPSDDNSYIYISEPVEPTKYATEEKKQYYSSGYQRKNKTYPKYKTQKRFNYTYPDKEDAPLIPPAQPLLLDQASVTEFVSMGFSKKVAYNIQKYISSGGKIYNAEQLLKIYGMDSVQLEKAIPYLLFPPRDPNRDFTTSFPKEKSANSRQSIIDLNKASIEELESLNGIGVTLAERIIKFRESLGGFISPDQLKDCYGLPPETFEQIKPHIQANGNPKMIAINETNLSTFVHPYLSKKLARIVQAYKDHHGPFVNADELRKVYPADSTWCNKILPYLSFEIEEDEN